MNRSFKLKIAAGLVVVFLAGGICGSVVTSRLSERAFVKAINPDGWSATMVKGLDENLSLTASQKDQVRGMADEAVAEMRGKFRDIGAILVGLHQRVQSILTPEQQKKNAANFKAFRDLLQTRFNISFPSESSNPEPEGLPAEQTNHSVTAAPAP